MYEFLAAEIFSRLTGLFLFLSFRTMLESCADNISRRVTHTRRRMWSAFLSYRAATLGESILAVFQELIAQSLKALFIVFNAVICTVAAWNLSFSSGFHGVGAYTHLPQELSYSDTTSSDPCNLFS